MTHVPRSISPSQGPANEGSGEQGLLVQLWKGGGVEAYNLSVSCVVPPLQPISVVGLGSSAYLVDDAAGIINAIVAAQNFTGGGGGSGVPLHVALLLRRNISFSQLYQQQASVQRLTIAINVTLMGIGDMAATVIDWAALNWVFAIYRPSVTLQFFNLTMMNLSPLRALVVPSMGYLPLFAMPFWPVW